MGDPGVAKSQLLNYIDRLAPRSKTRLNFLHNFCVITEWCGNTVGRALDLQFDCHRFCLGTIAQWL